MKRVRQATYEEKQSAVRCYAVLKSYRDVAALFNVSHTTIANWVKECRERKPYTSKMRGVKKAKVTSNIPSMIRENPLHSIDQLKSLLNISVSKSYMSRIIKHRCQITRKKARFYGHPKNLEKKTAAAAAGRVANQPLWAWDDAAPSCCDAASAAASAASSAYSDDGPMA